MVPLASSSQSLEMDLTLLAELYEEIETNPPALQARKLLIQQCVQAGWDGAARDAIQDLLSLSPFDDEVHEWSDILSAQSSTQQYPSHPHATTPSFPQPFVPKNIEEEQLELYRGYEALRARAAKLLRETCLVRDLASQLEDPKKETRDDKNNSIWNAFGFGSLFSSGKKKETPAQLRLEANVQNLKALADGKISSIVRVRQPGSAQAVVRAMESNAERALDIAVGDLEDVARWLRSSNSQSMLDNDGVREALVKRVGMLSSTLSEDRKKYATMALMHVEHEILQRNYVVDETMLGDKVSDIPRSRFFVTEDGYPWDMEELAQAIASNGGVMRNPLSHQMFTPNDIRMIVIHPLGKNLAALQIEQSKLKQGVRPKTIEELEKLSAVLLKDQSPDQMESRHTLDAFLAFVATLPESEQKALDKLRVPAKDSHSGQPFDASIGEAVRDGKANKVCMHKTGDLLTQAVQHLRSGRK